MRDAGRGCLPDPARKAHWIAMTSNPSGDGFTRGFDQLPPQAYEPDPALASYPPPPPTGGTRTNWLRPVRARPAVRIPSRVPAACLSARQTAQRHA
jgi:hypothetical protein